MLQNLPFPPDFLPAVCGAAAVCISGFKQEFLLKVCCLCELTDQIFITCTSGERALWGLRVLF